MSETLPAVGDHIRYQGESVAVVEVYPAGRNLVIDNWSGKQFYEPYPAFAQVRFPDGRTAYATIEALQPGSEP